MEEHKNGSAPTKYQIGSITKAQRDIQQQHAIKTREFYKMSSAERFHHRQQYNSIKKPNLINVNVSKNSLQVLNSAQMTSKDVCELEKIKTYKYQTSDGQTRYGFDADQVAEIFPELVIRTPNDKPVCVKENEIIPLLVETIKELRIRIAKLETASSSGSIFGALLK